MRFTFIHAADLHISSPLAGLGLKDRVVAERFAAAGRRAVEALADVAIQSQAAFLIVAGDIFDGDWKDVTTGLFFTRVLGRLEREGIETFIVKGNHDAENLMSKSLPYPEKVRIFRADAAESFALEERGVMLHGRSFATRRVSDDFVAGYPARREGWLNIGVLHTALDGTRGHETYAPCTVESLRRFGYDYWALGHIHAAEIVCRDPWVVYPGNLQGRSVRETGPKGAMRVTVEDGRIRDVEPIVLDCARWAHENVDVADCADETAVLAQIEARIAQLHQQAEGRPLAMRITLSGVTDLHARLTARADVLAADARALGFRFAEDCWLEQIKIATQAPEHRPALAASEEDILDISALLSQAAADPEFQASLKGLIATIAEKLPRELRASVSADDQALAGLSALARDHLLGGLALEPEP
jgi:DNA repair protein SbcD/Mre11